MFKLWVPVGCYTQEKKKTDYMLLDTRSRLSVPHTPKIWLNFYYTVVKQNKQNPFTEPGIRPCHLAGPHSTCEIMTNHRRWIYSLTAENKTDHDSISWFERPFQHTRPCSQAFWFAPFCEARLQKSRPGPVAQWGWAVLSPQSSLGPRATRSVWQHARLHVAKTWEGVTMGSLCHIVSICLPTE